jgi:prefoldin subunit 5
MGISQDSKKAIRWEIEKLSQLKKRIKAKKDVMKANVDSLNAQIDSVTASIAKLESDLNG